MAATVPCSWPGATIVCAASGPSLTADDISACQAAGTRIVAINNTFLLAPTADVLFAGDRKWWFDHPEALSHPGQKYRFPPAGGRGLESVRVLGLKAQKGFSMDRDVLCSGGHSGYAAINLAAHLVCPGGRILLLGYDMQPSPIGRHHWHDDHPDGRHPRYEKWLDLYRQLPTPLEALGITCLNCSRATAITALPRMSLEDALAG